MRKSIVVLLLFCTLTACPQTRSKSSTTITEENRNSPLRQYENDFETDWDNVSDGVVITVYSGSKQEVSIPPRIQNYPVTSISEYAFLGCKRLTGVNISDSVTSIRDYAFYSTGLTSVTIPNSVAGIGKYAFAWCESLTSVTIPNNVTSIGEWAFYECTSLTSVTFQGTIASSGFADEVFKGLGDLRDKFYAADRTNGTPGTYTRVNGSRKTWTRR